MKLDFPELFGPNNRVSGLMGICRIFPNALKFPNLMEVVMIDEHPRELLDCGFLCNIETSNSFSTDFLKLLIR